jgi:hypothetical protein
MLVWSPVSLLEEVAIVRNTQFDQRILPRIKSHQANCPDFSHSTQSTILVRQTNRTQSSVHSARSLLCSIVVPIRLSTLVHANENNEHLIQDRVSSPSCGSAPSSLSEVRCIVLLVLFRHSLDRRLGSSSQHISCPLSVCSMRKLLAPLNPFTYS